MSGNYYFLINAHAPGLAGIRAECTQRHAAATNGRNVLSEDISLDGSEIKIKVAGVDQSWLDSQGWVSDHEKCLFFCPQVNDPGDEGMAVIQAWDEAQRP